MIPIKILPWFLKLPLFLQDRQRSTWRLDERCRQRRARAASSRWCWGFPAVKYPTCIQHSCVLVRSVCFARILSAVSRPFSSFWMQSRLCSRSRAITTDCDQSWRSCASLHIDHDGWDFFRLWDRNSRNFARIFRVRTPSFARNKGILYHNLFLVMIASA